MDIFSAGEQVYLASDTNGVGLHDAALPFPKETTLYSINCLNPDWKARAASLASKPKTPRFSLNVSSFKNFVFECDSLDLQTQLEEWTSICTKLPIKQLTYSGGKSYHAVISCIDELPLEPHAENSVIEYKKIWKALANFIEKNSKLKLDQSTKDPARLTRIPNALRNGITQTATALPELKYATCEQVYEIYANYGSAQAPYAAVVQTGPKSKTELLKHLGLYKNRRLWDKVNNPKFWAAPENMYPAIFRLTLWAIDTVAPSRQSWEQVLEDKVFPTIKSTGYSRDLYLPVKAAYMYKGKT